MPAPRPLAVDPAALGAASPEVARVAVDLAEAFGRGRRLAAIVAGCGQPATERALTEVDSRLAGDRLVEALDGLALALWAAAETYAAAEADLARASATPTIGRPRP